MAAKKRTAKFLALDGPKDGQWLTIDEGLQAGYKQYNRAHSWGEPRKLTAILIHNASIKVKAGVTW